MTEPLTPKQIPELAAGYVLGNLTPEEAEAFQQLLLNHPELDTEVARLQETLGLMAYGLTETLPPSNLLSNILETVAANFDSSSDTLPQNRTEITRHTPLSSTTRFAEADSGVEQPHQKGERMTPLAAPQWSTQFHRFRQFRLSKPWIVGGAVALLTLTLGLENNRLRQQIQILQTQLAQQETEIAGLQQTLSSYATPVTDVITITPSNTFFASNWQGIEQLAQDHVRSLMRPQASVEVASSDPEEIAKRLQSHFSQPPALALLTQADSTLLGGSPCQFGQNRGLRLAYQVNQAETVSLYQLERIESDSFPQPGETRLYMNQSDGPGIVFWGDESFLYAIVAELPAEKLKQLAEQVVRSG